MGRNVVVVVGGSRAGHLRKFLEARALRHGSTLCGIDFAERFKEQEVDPRTTNLRVLPLAPRTVPTLGFNRTGVEPDPNLGTTLFLR